MITKLEKLSDGKFILNECIIVSDITLMENNISYEMNFDADIITEEEAGEIASGFILEALDAAIKKEEN